MKRFLLNLFLLMAPVGMLAQVPFVHPWQAARVAFFGDSITDARVVPGNNGIKNPDNHDWTGRGDNHYWGYLQEWLGIHPYVYGVNGRQWDDIPDQADRLKAEHGDEFDAILILIGTNDYISDVLIGEWYDETPQTVTAALGYPATEFLKIKRTPSMDGTTLKGRINIAMDKLKRMFPEKQIVLLTPIHRAFAQFGSGNIQPEESYPNRLGLYIHDYVEAIKEAANVWSVPMIEEHAGYFANPETDKLHPSAKGHERIAKTLMYQLSALPCRL